MRLDIYSQQKYSLNNILYCTIEWTMIVDLMFELPSLYLDAIRFPS